MKRRVLLFLTLATAVFGTSCRPRNVGLPARSTAKPSAATTAAHARALKHLCAGAARSDCSTACAPTLATREHAKCLIDFRFADDAKALGLAHELYDRTGALPGLDTTTSQGTYDGTRVLTRPALPIGDDRRHLAWILASFDRYEAFLKNLAAAAKHPIDFQLHPDAIVFFRTDTPSYPSAWGQHGVVGYNLRGPLHTSERNVLETLFHELFHLNDERKKGWSVTTLGKVFEGILARCGSDHACFENFAPHDTRVPEGTYYPFDKRTRDVREYAAELALRYFLEHEAIQNGSPLEPPFKCRTEENLAAWQRLVDAFFGGADLTRACNSGRSTADSTARSAAPRSESASPPST